MKLVPIVDLTVVNIVIPTVYTGGGASSTGIDVSAYEGMGLAILSVLKVVEGTFTLGLNSGPTTAGGTDIASAQFTAITSAVTTLQALPVDLSTCGKYVRATWTNVGASSAYNFNVILLAQKKYV
jgi:hypothetical protein